MSKRSRRRHKLIARAKANKRFVLRERRALKAVSRLPGAIAEKKAIQPPVLTLNKATAQSLICPYCRSDLGNRRSSCPTCETGYHLECAEVFWKCAIRGCPGYLRDPDQVQVLPRLPRFAARLDQWDFSPDREIRPHALISMPMSWDERGSDQAARTVGEIMGETALDGRLRLSNPYPELLMQTRGDRAHSLVEQLQSQGLQALAIPMEEMLQPLTCFSAVNVQSTGSELSFADKDGKRRVFTDTSPRLVVSAHSIIEHRVGSQFKGQVGFRSKSRVKKRSEKEVAFIFDAQNSVPVFVDLGKVRAAALRSGRCALLIEDFSLKTTKSALTSVEGDRSQALLYSTGSASSLTNVFANLSSLSLIARILFLQWRGGLELRVWNGSEGSAKDGKKVAPETLNKDQ
jgi:hypothetical protein